ncbi:MAG: MFS transporter [Candidatus Thorarchaeota archaeon]
MSNTEAGPNSSGFFSRLRTVFRSRNFTVILLTNYTGSVFIAAFIYLNLFFRDVGISYFELGVANGWAAFVGFFGTMLGGYWADACKGKYRKVMATFNKFFITIAILAIAFTTNLLGLLFAWTVFGISQFCQSSIDPILFESLPPDHMGTGTSLFTLGGAFGLLGLLVVGFLIRDGFVAGLRIFWLLAAVSSFIDFVIRWVFLEQTQHSQDAAVAEAGRFAQDLFQQYRTGLKVLASTIPLFLIVFLLDVLSDVCYSFAQTFFLNEDVGMDYSAINSVMIGSLAIGMIGGLFAGALLDKSRSEARVMFLAYLLLPFSVLLLLYSPIYPRWTSYNSLGTVIASTAFVAVVIKAGNDVVWRTIAWGAVGRKLPREHTGKVMAILSMMISLAFTVAMPVAGYIYEVEGGVPLLVIALVLNITILCLLLVGWIRSDEDHPDQIAEIDRLETPVHEIIAS